MNDYRRRRDDEPTAEIAVPVKPLPIIASHEQMETGQGGRIKSLIDYQLLSFRLRERKDPCWLITLDTNPGSKIIVAYVFKTHEYVVDQLQIVTFDLHGVSHSYAPALREGFSRDFLQKSLDFYSSDPPIVVKPSVIRRYTAAIDLEESRTIPPPDKLPLVKESGNICGILSMREAKFIEEQRKALKER
ncbi:MAG: hypothetical protein U0487_03750 [Patescibacteria group bacterium]